jgi:hypothetical protein
MPLSVSKHRSVRRGPPPADRRRAGGRAPLLATVTGPVHPLPLACHSDAQSNLQDQCPRSLRPTRCSTSPDPARDQKGASLLLHAPHTYQVSKAFNRHHEMRSGSRVRFSPMMAGAGYRRAQPGNGISEPVARRRVSQVTRGSMATIPGSSGKSIRLMRGHMTRFERRDINSSEHTPRPRMQVEHRRGVSRNFTI